MEIALRIAKFITVIFILAIASLILWWFSSTGFADSAALNLAKRDESVQILDLGDRIEITPKTEDTLEQGYIFYPGGLVMPDAYIYRMTQLAKAAQIRVVIVKFWFNLAITDIGAADRVITTHPEVVDWIIGGHSLGGAMACRYAKENASKLNGLILQASYCDQDISQSDLPVLAIVGTKDEILDRQAWLENVKNLPADHKYEQIPGMNHSQFGNYGTQRGDGQSEIPELQANRTILTTISYLIPLDLDN